MRLGRSLFLRAISASRMFSRIRVSQVRASFLVAVAISGLLGGHEHALVVHHPDALRAVDLVGGHGEGVVTSGSPALVVGEVVLAHLVLLICGGEISMR